MNYLSPLLFIAFFLFFSCKSESEKTLDKFKKIHESLKKTKIDLYEDVYNRISSQKANNAQLFLIAGSLVNKLEITNKFIDSIIMIVERTDPTGERTDVGTSLLTKTETGDELINLTNSVYLNAVQYSENQSSKKEIEHCFKKYSGLFGKRQFNEAFIDKTPSVGVTSILRGVKSDCAKSTFICLKDIEYRLN